MVTLTTKTTFSSRKTQNADLRAKVSQLALPLAPLVQLSSGRVHPSFPQTLLRYHLLTDAELEDLAHFYHQRTPCALTSHYPKPMNWKQGLTVNEKKRKWGRFMGLRGCESPVVVKTEEEIWEEARGARLVEEEEMWRRKREWY
jgi:hypothetical protein